MQYKRSQICSETFTNRREFDKNCKQKIIDKSKICANNSIYGNLSWKKPYDVFQIQLSLKKSKLGHLGSLLFLSRQSKVLKPLFWGLEHTKFETILQLNKSIIISNFLNAYFELLNWTLYVQKVQSLLEMLGTQSYIE